MKKDTGEKTGHGWLQDRYEKLPHVPRDCIVLVTALCSAYYASTILLQHTGVENNSALVFTLAVAVVSILTDGYLYGVAGSIVGAFSPTTTSWPPTPNFPSAGWAIPWRPCPC